MGIHLYEAGEPFFVYVCVFRLFFFQKHFQYMPELTGCLYWIHTEGELISALDFQLTKAEC